MPAPSTKPWVISAPVATTAWTQPRSIISQSTRPCFAIVIAPEIVTTRKQLSSRTIASSTSAASPRRRPPKAVFAIAATSASTESSRAEVERDERLEPVVVPGAVVVLRRASTSSGVAPRSVRPSPRRTAGPGRAPAVQARGSRARPRAPIGTERAASSSCRGRGRRSRDPARPRRPTSQSADDARGGPAARRDDDHRVLGPQDPARALGERVRSAGRSRLADHDHATRAPRAAQRDGAQQGREGVRARARAAKAWFRRRDRRRTHRSRAPGEARRAQRPSSARPAASGVAPSWSERGRWISERLAVAGVRKRSPSVRRRRSARRSRRRASRRRSRNRSPAPAALQIETGLEHRGVVVEEARHVGAALVVDAQQAARLVDASRRARSPPRATASLEHRVVPEHAVPARARPEIA